MKNIALILLLNVLTLPLSATPFWAQYKWQSRIVVYYAESESDMSASIVNAHQYEWAFSERRLRFIVVFEETVRRFPDNGDNVTLQPDNAYAVSPGESLLIGLDGGIKHHYTDLVWQEIFRDIDRMPMRRAEIEQRKQSKDS
ncbi:DUF4174 domain-containing protein [Alteromonas sediminis]|nr:DUF4174 domain-containing protein [Alteromonas sediminis]